MVVLILRLLLCRCLPLVLMLTMVIPLLLVFRCCDIRLSVGALYCSLTTCERGRLAGVLLVRRRRLGCCGRRCLLGCGRR